MKRYHAFFSKENWGKVEVTKRKNHAAFNCTECPNLAEYALKKSNIPYIKRIEDQKKQQEQQIPQHENRLQELEQLVRQKEIEIQQNEQRRLEQVNQLQETLCAVRRELQQQKSRNLALIEQQAHPRRVTITDITPGLKNIIYKGITKEKVPKRVANQILKDSMNLGRIPNYLKKKIIDDAQKRQMNSEMELELRSIYVGNLSFRKHDKLRAMRHGKYIKNRKKKHIGPLLTYHFNKEIVKTRLEEIGAGLKDLGSSMDGKWNGLAKQAGVKKRIGPQPTYLNGGQVRRSPRL